MDLKKSIEENKKLRIELLIGFYQEVFKENIVFKEREFNLNEKSGFMGFMFLRYWTDKEMITYIDKTPNDKNKKKLEYTITTKGIDFVENEILSGNYESQ